MKQVSKKSSEVGFIFTFRTYSGGESNNILNTYRNENGMNPDKKSNKKF